MGLFSPRRRAKKYFVICGLLIVTFNLVMDIYLKPRKNYNTGQHIESITNTTLEMVPNHFKPRCFRLTWNGDIFSRNRCTYLTFSSRQGRLGNYMFRVGALLGAAAELDFVPVIPDSSLLSKCFMLPNILAKGRIENLKDFSESSCCKYYSEITSLSQTSNWTLHGYLQSWRYFNNSRGVIKDAFKFKPEYVTSAKTVTSELREKNASSLVCVHVRRRDMTLPGAIAQGYVPAGVEYISRAMTFFEEVLDSVQFIVLSDDKSWAGNNIKGKNVFHSKFTDPCSDMALMVSCDHVIITSGSFGWWGAWLSGGRVVYFKGFPRKGSPLARETELKDYYPVEWVGLD